MIAVVKKEDIPRSHGDFLDTQPMPEPRQQSGSDTALPLPQLEDLIRMTYRSILSSERTNASTYWFLGDWLKQARSLVKLGEGDWVDYCTNILKLDNNRRRRAQRLRKLYDTVNDVPKDKTLMEALGYSPSFPIKEGKAKAAARKSSPKKPGDKDGKDVKEAKEKPAEHMTEAEYRDFCAFVDAVGSLQRAVEVTRQGMLRYLKEEQT